MHATFLFTFKYIVFEFKYLFTNTYIILNTLYIIMKALTGVAPPIMLTSFCHMTHVFPVDEVYLERLRKKQKRKRTNRVSDASKIINRPLPESKIAEHNSSNYEKLSQQPKKGNSWGGLYSMVWDGSVMKVVNIRVILELKLELGREMQQFWRQNRPTISRKIYSNCMKYLLKRSTENNIFIILLNIKYFNVGVLHTLYYCVSSILWLYSCFLNFRGIRINGRYNFPNYLKKFL